MGMRNVPVAAIDSPGGHLIPYGNPESAFFGRWPSPSSCPYGLTPLHGTPDPRRSGV